MEAQILIIHFHVTNHTSSWYFFSNLSKFHYYTFITFGKYRKKVVTGYQKYSSWFIYLEYNLFRERSHTTWGFFFFIFFQYLMHSIREFLFEYPAPVIINNPKVFLKMNMSFLAVRGWISWGLLMSSIVNVDILLDCMTTSCLMEHIERSDTINNICVFLESSRWAQWVHA